MAHLYLVELAVVHVGRGADQPVGLVDADLGHALQLHGGSEALRSPVSSPGWGLGRQDQDDMLRLWDLGHIDGSPMGPVVPSLASHGEGHPLVSQHLEDDETGSKDTF